MPGQLKITVFARSRVHSSPHLQLPLNISESQHVPALEILLRLQCVSDVSQSLPRA